MGISTRYAVGGQIELSGLPSFAIDTWSDPTRGSGGCWTSSGRAALALVFRAIRRDGVRAVSLPAFVCPSVVTTAEANGLSVSFYPVDLELRPTLPSASDAAVLMVDYFGWRSEGLDDFSLQASATSPLIEDASQALFASWPASAPQGHYVVLSPRKFAPVTICGWCNLKGERLPPAPSEVEGFAWRSLAARLIKGAYLSASDAPVDREQEELYLSAFAAVEDYLDAHLEPAAIPDIGWSLVRRTDWQEVARARRGNWLLLGAQLRGRVDPVFESLPDEVVPLGYVVRLADRDRVREELARRRIFCAVHWPLAPQVSGADFPSAVRLSETLLTLPIDQRYSPRDIERLAQVVKEVV